jgi:hypothetical protein
MVPVSAKKGTGIDDLLTHIVWAAEEKQLTANPTRAAAGTVIEAHMDRQRGPIATMLVQTGTLKTGGLPGGRAAAAVSRGLGAQQPAASRTDPWSMCALHLTCCHATCHARWSSPRTRTNPRAPPPAASPAVLQGT